MWSLFKPSEWTMFFHLKKEERLKFKPTDDITVSELAQIISKHPFMMSGSKKYINTFPENLQRHFWSE